MAETVGSQLFGPWYDILGMALTSGMFFYFAYAEPPFYTRLRKSFPFMNRRACVVAAMCAGAVACYKLANMHEQRSAALASAFSPAPQWQLVPGGDNGDTLSIDTKSIIRKGGTVGYSLQVAFQTPRQVPMSTDPVTSVQKRVLVNCAEQTVILEELAMFRSDGTAIYHQRSATVEVRPLSSDATTADLAASTYLCAQR